MNSSRTLVVLLLVVFIATVGYGVSFPLLAISLENMGISSSLIGLNAAMPAVGWIIASIALPQLHKLFSPRALMTFFLLFAVVGLVGFSVSENYLFWLLCRFLFGGGLGMFFRTFEFYLNLTAPAGKRGNVLGLYITIFLAGIIIGSVVQPVFSVNTFVPFGFILTCLVLSVLLLQLSGTNVKVAANPVSNPVSLLSIGTIKNLFVVVPLAASGAIVYGLVESIPAYLMPVYALKVGYSEVLAAYTLSAFAAGNIVFAIPLGIISDKFGRVPVIFCCVAVGVLALICIPFLIDSVTLFFAALVVLGGCIVGLYSISLALVGDKYSQSSLIFANATFGILYALGSLIGPLLHGIAMDLYDPHGLIFSAVLFFFCFLGIGYRFLGRVES